MAAPTRWELIRDVLALQAKLVVDGLRDLLLSPLSLLAAIADLLTGGERPGRRFYALLRLGRRSETWIDLFGAARRLDPASGHDAPGARLDDLFDRLETVLVEEHRRGGVTASAKQTIDRLLDSVQLQPPER